MILTGWVLLLWGLVVNATESTLEIVYMSQTLAAPPALSNLDPIIEDKGVQGARLSITDNNTTGRFTGQYFKLKEIVEAADSNIEVSLKKLVESGYQHFVTNLQAEVLTQLATSGAGRGSMFYDVASRDDSLRQGACLPNVLHFLPSRAMRADALAQYMLKKRWTKWFLVIGPEKADKLYAHAIYRAAKRYGMKIVEAKVWEHVHDARRTAQSEIPVFTQGDDYDILLVADEAGLFGEYLAYRTWIPRPVAGTQGLVATAWHRTHEQWGAVQLQNRFRKQAGRWMAEEDYAAWLAIRAIGEAATRRQSLELEKIRAYMFSESFALAGFKGQKLNFRRWNGQLRQPVLLAADRSMVAAAPLDGFLHPSNELDTLGFDEPESKCLLPSANWPKPPT